MNAIGASASFWHLPSGFFGAFAYNYADVDFDDVDAAALPSNGDDFETNAFYIKLGIQRRFNALGQTAFYGEYGNSDLDSVVDANDEDMDFFGVGMVQLISAAATELYIGYRHIEDSDDDEIDYVMMGARIKF